MTSPILVTGGTGTLGKHVVPLLRAAGRDVRVLCRTPRESADGVEYVACDLLKGEGIEAALDGVDTVLHLAGGPKGDDKATANLVEAAKKAGVGHLVYIGVIGADKLPIGYFKSKLAAEAAIESSGVPFTIVRAAQFHDFVWMTAEKMAKMPIVPIPGGLRFQPVAAEEVAERLVELTLGAPQGRVADIAGPKVYGLRELMEGYLGVRGKKKMFMGMRMPGKAGKAYRAGENLTIDGADKGKATWEDFLSEKVG